MLPRRWEHGNQPGRPAQATFQRRSDRGPFHATEQRRAAGPPGPRTLLLWSLTGNAARRRGRRDDPIALLIE
jgi:hypothetical protein